MKRTIIAIAIAILLVGADEGSAKIVEANLTIDTGNVNFTGNTVEALTVNGGIPGPTLEFTEGDIARIHVRNNLDSPSSVHWHGLLVPPQEDGVPFVSFPGIAPHTTFTYEFPIRQAGTYWYHSHTGSQEQRGVYGSIVIHPRGPENPRSDRDYVVVLSDWIDENPERVMGLLKSGNEWYSIKRNTGQNIWGALRRNRIIDFFRREWESMPANEINDVAYDKFLINGQTDERLAAKPGETVRLRIINAGASSYFYVQFAGGPMTVVASDGLDVEPFQIDRLLVAVAETYDVIVTVPSENAFELRATAQDGSGHGTLLVGEGERVAAPDVPKPDYYQNTMNSSYLSAATRTAWDVAGSDELLPPLNDEAKATEQGNMAGGMKMGGGKMKMAAPAPGRPPTPYGQLRSTGDTSLSKASPRRVIKMNLTGDMERYVWSINGKVLSPSDTIRIRKGERVRFEMSNRTMMNHPMHLHGHFFRVLNGQGSRAPLKHTVNVAPMQTTVIEFDANEEKDWFFHCHILYHMKAGMERIVHYEGTEVDAATLAVRPQLYDQHWYAFGDVSVLSQMSQGSAQVVNTHNTFGLGWEVGYDNGDYDITSTYSYYVNRYLSGFAGVNAYQEVESGSDVRGVFGLSWLLPLNIRSSIWVGTDESFRWSAGKELPLTRRLTAFTDVEYDSVTEWEWTAGAEYTLTRNLSLYGQYNSEFGGGGGARLRFFSSGF
ncbi:multicopper oxidase domain-containing protein [Myxococcota bacterium]|nr:multicopper oxidase domain-containing protein [Myxococcota bacterium]